MPEKNSLKTATQTIEYTVHMVLYERNMETGQFERGNKAMLSL